MQSVLARSVAPGLRGETLARALESVDLTVDLDAVRVRWSGIHSNDVYDVHVGDGRRLILKRGRHDWVRARFANAARAAGLLAEAGIIAPEPIALPDDVDHDPIQAYWRLPQVTLQTLWADLADRARARAMESWGELLRRIHGVRVEGWGPLGPPGSARDDLDAFLRADLEERLLPACRGMWPSAVDPLEQLVELAPAVAARVEATPTLVHNDLHMGNVLCRAEGPDRARCVGVLDLEDAAGAPPESDVASLEALHGPLFNLHVEDRWRGRVWDAYDGALDPWLVRYFRGHQLANLGFHSALVGDEAHAEQVARSLHEGMQKLESDPAPAP